MNPQIPSRLVLALSLAISLTSCFALRTGDGTATRPMGPPPAVIAEVFAGHQDGVLRLGAKDPGTDYGYDPSEKDTQFAGDDLAMRFRKVEMRLRDAMPLGTVLVDLVFIDGEGSRIEVAPVDLLRLTPALDCRDEMQYPEMLLEEYSRFGVMFRREHDEFTMNIASEASNATRSAADRAYRLGIWNNCLDATKWEMILFSEDYGDFDKRLAGQMYVNQKRTLAHNWFYMQRELYDAMMALKNPGLEVDAWMDYESLSERAQEVVIDLDGLRKVKWEEPIEIIEIGHQSGRKLEPINPEQYYKWQVGLILNKEKFTSYSDVLDQPVSIAQFGDCGFYQPEVPNDFDFGWMRELDDLELDILEVPGSDCYAQIILRGEDSPYTIVLGNVDLAQLDEQRYLGLAFGINPYPKSRRHNPEQDTIRFEADRIPDHIKPYLLMMDAETGTWINNQKVGIEKVFLGWTSIERNEIEIYVVTYERILSVWMARVRLPDGLVDRIRVRRRLYDYR